MAHFDWNSDYDTGIAGIDYENARLAEMLNNIHQSILNNVSSYLIGDTLAECHALAAAHFALAEKIMRDENCCDLAWCRRTHYRLLDQMRDIMDAYDAGAYRSDESLAAALKEWLSEIFDVDARLFAKIDKSGLRR